MNTKLLDALNCKNQGRPPVWLMRQAGRYLPEYRALRQKYSFLEMCHTPEIAAEVTLMPIRKFGMDAAILYSDILVIPEALDFGLRFEEQKGPIIEHAISTPNDIKGHSWQLENRLQYVADAIRLIKPQLDVPLIGFAGGPFTVASYLIEGGTSRNFKKIKKFLLHHPEAFQELLAAITQCTIDYLNMQVEAGVDALQIFDSWAHVLNAPHFEKYSLHYMKAILQGIHNKDIPVILFCKGSSVFAQAMASASPAGIGLDWNADISHIRTQIPPPIALQGNLDPDILYAPLPTLRTEVQRLLKSMKGDPGYIFNLGHGITPDVPVEAVQTLVDTIHTFD